MPIQELFRIDTVQIHYSWYLVAASRSCDDTQTGRHVNLRRETLGNTEMSTIVARGRQISVLTILNSQDRHLLGLCRANTILLRVPVRWSLSCSSMWSAGDLLIRGICPPLIPVSSEETVGIFDYAHIEGLYFKLLSRVAMGQLTTLTPLATLSRHPLGRQP